MNSHQKLQQFLMAKGANKIPHGNRTLFDHLMGCYQLAKLSGESDRVALAAGLHSVYSTDAFSPVLIPNREEIKKTFGEQIELLVYFFHCLDRRGKWFWKIAPKNRHVQLPLEATTQQIADLRRIECYNLIEQLYPS